MKKGDKVVLRSNMAGVFFGTLEKFDGRDVELRDARKLYYWSGANAVEQIARDGVQNAKDCKFTVTVKELIVMDCCQVIKCEEKAIKCIEGVKEWIY